jgi:hypothetical protein
MKITDRIFLSIVIANRIFKILVISLYFSYIDEYLNFKTFSISCYMLHKSR